MKDFENQNEDHPQVIGISKPKVGQQPAQHASGSDTAPAMQKMEALNAPELSHPANAAPLADLFGQLQQSHGNSYVQRLVAEMDDVKPAAKSQTTQGGRTLDSGIRSEMESAFGENFSDVRVHTDADAEKLTDELGARAATRGRDIYFGRSEYDAGTRDGKALLAHELAHVLQQEGTANRQANSIGQTGDTFEQEADRAAAAFLAGQRPAIVNRATTPAYQRQVPGPRPPAAAPTSAPAPHHWFVGDPESETSFGTGRVWITETGISPDHYYLHVTFPPELHFEIEGGTGATVRVRPNPSQARTVIDLDVNRRQRLRPTVRITLFQGRIEFQMYFHFRRRHGRRHR